MDSLEIRVVEGADAGARFTLAEGGFIGRGSACRIRLSDPSVQPMHARVRVVGDKYILTDVSDGAGVQINDAPVKSRPLQAGDRIRLGSLLMEAVASASPSKAVESPPMQAAAAPAAAPAAGHVAASRRPVAGIGQGRGRPGPSASVPVSPSGSVGEAEPVALPQDVAVSASPAPKTPVWAVSGVIAAIVVAVVTGLWIHLLSLRRDVEQRCRDVVERSKAGQLSQAQALERYRGVLADAVEVHPRMAEGLKKMIRDIEAEMLVQDARTSVALKDLDSKADELAAKGDYAAAADVYRGADPALGKAVEDTRTARLAELERLAAGQSAGQARTE